MLHAFMTSFLNIMHSYFMFAKATSCIPKSQYITVRAHKKMLYLPPLCCMCGIHLFISIASVIDAVLGLLCTETEELHFQLIFLVAIHIGYLAKYLASHLRK